MAPVTVEQRALIAKVLKVVFDDDRCHEPVYESLHPREIGKLALLQEQFTDEVNKR